MMRRDFFGQFELKIERRAGFEADLFRLTDQVSGGEMELLSFPVVEGEPDRVSMGRRHLCIDVEDGLDIVFSRRKVSEA
jgi:hypothetical protein